MTELHEACAIGDEEVVQDLIFKGSNLNEKDQEWGGRTPLHWAVSNCHYYVTQQLINSGGSVNARMNNGWTPLHCAAEAGSRKLVKLLLEHGANPWTSDRYGDTPLDVARVYHKVEVVETLENFLNANGPDVTLEEEEKMLELGELQVDPG